MAKRAGRYPDVIIESTRICDEIKRQMAHSGLNIKDLASKIESYGHKMPVAGLSRYLSQKRGIPQRDVMFLAKMFGIVIRVDVSIDELNHLTLKRNLKKLKESWYQDS